MRNFFVALGAAGLLASSGAAYSYSENIVGLTSLTGGYTRPYSFGTNENFTDVYTFTLGAGAYTTFSWGLKITGVEHPDNRPFGSGDLTASLTNLAGTSLFNWVSSSTNVLTGWTSPPANQLYANTLGSGTYELTLDFKNPHGSGAYTMNVSAVPEPEFYAMMLAGLGMIGVIAHRRRKIAAA